MGVAESRAICRYLAEKYGNRGTSLLGKDPLERAAIEQWLKFEEHKFDPPSWALAFYLGFAPPPPPPSLAATVRDDVRKLGEVLDVYEQRLAESEFLAGDEFTMADLFHLPTTHHILSPGSSTKTFPQVSELFSSKKNVSRWWETISRRPSWKKVVDLLDSVPIRRTSLLAGAPESAETLQQSASTMFSKASRAKTMAEAASQLGLPPPSQSTENTSQPKTSGKQGDGPGISQRSFPSVTSKSMAEEAPLPDPRRSDVTASPKDTAEAALQGRQTSELGRQQATRSTPSKTESEASASSSSAKAMSESLNSKGAEKVERKSEEKSSLINGKKTSPETAVARIDGGSPAKADSNRTAPSMPPKNDQEAAILDITKLGTEKLKLKSDDDKSTKIDKTATPQLLGSPSPTQAADNALSNQTSADDAAGLRGNKVGGIDFLHPTTKIDFSSLLYSLAKNETKASSQAGNRSGETPSNASTTDSQRPSSPLSSRKETEAAAQSTTKPSSENQSVRGDLNGPAAFRPPGPSPGPATGSQPARQAASSGSTPSNPRAVSGVSELSSNEARGEGDTPGTPSTDVEP